MNLATLGIHNFPISFPNRKVSKENLWSFKRIFYKHHIFSIEGDLISQIIIYHLHGWESF
jgi:hypothetical protein